MKILFCANIFERTQVGPARLAEGLLKINDLYHGKHELRVLTADVKEERYPVYKMDVRYPSFLRFFDFLFRGWAFYKGILRVQKEFDFDVVLFGNATYGLVTKVFHVQLLVGGFINDYNIVSVKWSNFFKHAGGKSLVLLSYAERLAARKLDFIFICSDFLRRAILNRYGTPEKNLNLLYQGIDLEKIPYRSRHIEATERIKILFVKYRHRIGGLNVLAKALSKLSMFSFDLTVLGPPREDEKEISGGFENMPHVNLEFKGAVAQEVVHSYLSSHDILCIPSLFEAQGLANIEGLAHGISVVSTNCGGIPEVLDFGKCGWLCEPDNPASLAFILKECILASDGERQQKSQYGRVFVDKQFNYQIMLRNLINILEKKRSTKS